MKTYKSSDLTHKRSEVMREAESNGCVIQECRTNGAIVREFVVIPKSEYDRLDELAFNNFEGC